MFRRPRLSQVIGPGTAVLVAAAFVLGLPASWLTLRGQQPTFRAAVDMIAIDVQVVDRDGRPVATLGPESFDVTLNGQKRRVQWAVFTRYDEASMAQATAAAETAATTHSMAGPDGLLARPSPAPGLAAEFGRTFIIAIDAGSFRTLDSHLAVLAAQRFIDGLLPTDLVGVFTVPSGPSLPPTANHAAAWYTVGEVMGQKLDVKNQFEFTPAEVIDILFALDMKPRDQLEEEARRNMRTRSTEGAADQFFSDEVISKYCSGTDPACLPNVISEARSVAFSLQTNAMMSIAGLEDLLTLLRRSPGRKTVLLLSGGMPLSDRGTSAPSAGNALRRMGEQAAYANATVHAIYFDGNHSAGFSAEFTRSRTSSIRSQTIDTRALSEFAAPSGGVLLTSRAGAGENAVDRLLAETSTSYVLGVEPDERDRDGLAHRIHVKVKQPGVNVRSRQLVVVPRSPKP
jgi:VWFA-related protein